MCSAIYHAKKTNIAYHKKKGSQHAKKAVIMMPRVLAAFRSLLILLLAMGWRSASQSGCGKLFIPAVLIPFICKCLLSRADATFDLKEMETMKAQREIIKMVFTTFRNGRMRRNVRMKEWKSRAHWLSHEPVSMRVSFLRIVIFLDVRWILLLICRHRQITAKDVLSPWTYRRQRRTFARYLSPPER